MITIKQQEKLVNQFELLSELELQSVLEDLYEIIRKRKCEHLIAELFDEELHDKMMDKLADETSYLEDEVDELKTKNESLTLTIETTQSKIREVISTLENI